MSAVGCQHAKAAVRRGVWSRVQLEPGRERDRALASLDRVWKSSLLTTSTHLERAPRDGSQIHARTAVDDGRLRDERGDEDAVALFLDRAEVLGLGRGDA